MIYDFGANDGVNLHYYLSKDSVVAVEANPLLCEQMRERFPQPIRDGRLTVLNVALSNQKSAVKRQLLSPKSRNGNRLLCHSRSTQTGQGSLIVRTSWRDFPRLRIGRSYCSFRGSIRRRVLNCFSKRLHRLSIISTMLFSSLLEVATTATSGACGLLRTNLEFHQTSFGLVI